MSHFKTLFDTYNWDFTLKSIFDKTAVEVKQALAKEKRDLEDFKALVNFNCNNNNINVKFLI